MLDPSASSECVHTGVDIFVQVQTLLCLGDTTSSVHVNGIQEIRMTVMQLSADPRERTGSQGTKCLFLSSGDVSKNTDVLRKDVLPSSQDGDGRFREGGTTPLSVGTLARDIEFLKLGEHVTDLETLLQIVVLVRVDELEVFSTVKDDGMVLVVRFTVSQNRVSGQFDPKLGSPSAVGQDLGVTIDKSREDPGLATLLARRLLVEVGDLQIGISAQEEFGILVFLLVELGVTLHRDDKLELSAGHPLELSLQLVRVAAKELNDFRVLDTVQELDRLRVVHETRDRTVEGLCTQRRPDTGSQGVFGRGRLETDGVEGNVVRLFRIALFIRATTEGVLPREHGRFLGQNLGVLDKVLPLDGVKLLEVFQQGNTRVLILLSDNLPERQQDLFRVVRHQNRKGRHSVDRQGLGQGGRERLRKERDSPLRFASVREEFDVGRALLSLGDEEGGRAKGPLALVVRGNLVVEQLLNMVDRKQMLSVHRDDDGVPDLRYQDLGLVLDFHVVGGQELGVDSLGQPHEDVFPRRPNAHAEGKRPSDTEDRVPDDVPEESVQEEEDEIHDEHDRERKRGLVAAETGTKRLVVAVLHLHTDHDPNGITERQGQEEVTLGELETENEDPEHDGCDPRAPLQFGVRGGKGLVGQVLSVLAGDSISEHSARGDDGEHDDRGDGETELDDTDDERDLRALVKEGNVDRGSTGDGQDDQQEDQSPR